MTIAAFRLSWVADLPVNGSIEYCPAGVGGCSSSSLAGNATSSDAQPLLPSGAVLVEVSGLSAGTQYFYRGVSRDAANATSYHPASPPYPSVTTMTNSDPGAISNPLLVLGPYVDEDSDSACGPADVRAPRFIAYLNHSGARPLAARGGGSNSGCSQPALAGWIVLLSAENFRDADAVGAPHVLSGGESLEYSVRGNLDSGGWSHFRNLSGSLVWDGSTSQYTIMVAVERGASVPEAAPLSALVGAMLVAGLAVAHPSRARVLGDGRSARHVERRDDARDEG